MKSRTFPKVARSYRFPKVPPRMSAREKIRIHRGFLTDAKMATIAGTAAIETHNQSFFAS